MVDRNHLSVQNLIGYWLAVDFEVIQSSPTIACPQETPDPCRTSGYPGAVRQMRVATRARLPANHDRELTLSSTDRDYPVHHFQFEISHQHFAHCASKKYASYPLRDHSLIQRLL